MAAPFSFAPSQAWDGNDGSWSTFIVRVGTPAQDFRVLISTAGQETWVPVPQGCTTSDPSDCATSRGALPFNGANSKGFEKNESSTWKENDISDLYLENGLGYGGNGDYGFDTVGLKVENSGGPTLEQQTVAGIADKDFYLGIFGLGIKPANFSDFDHPYPAFIPTLKDKGIIPSLSYAYTAGAPYRLQKVLGSLTLGGYDASIYGGNSKITLPFGSDDSRPLIVGISGISATNTTNGDVILLSSDKSILSFIDSTVPHIWLPQAVCDSFEQAFSLTYDNDTGLYLVDDDTHTKLVSQNANVTISLSAGLATTSKVTLDLTLPYAAFDLNASSPIYPNSTRYFPIRRADNDTQYTLGRTFLQEAYLVVDYERSRFSIYQAAFQDPMPAPSLITISAFSNSTSGNSTSLSSGATAGIAVGAIVGAVLLIGLAWWFFRRRRSEEAKKRGQEYTPVEMTGDDKARPDEWAKVQQLDETSRSELPSSYKIPGAEMPAGNVPDRFGGGSATPRSELPSPRPPELPTPEPSRYELPS